MNRIRLLPVVLFAASSLLCLKLLGLVAGVGSFAVGPAVAVAAGDAEPALPVSTSGEELLGMPVDLASEAEALRLQREAEAAKAAAEADGHAASGEEGHGPADASTGDAAHPPADPETAEAGEPADAPRPPGIAAAPADHSAPADHGADAGHGEPAAAAGVSTERPAEYQPPGGGAESRVLESLAARREALDRREEELDLRLKLLDAAEAKLQARIEELKALEAQLARREEEMEAEATEKARELAVMYEAMKPKAAARVFNDLEMGVLVPVARTMNPRKLSAVLAVMDPERAGALTRELAGDQRPQQVVVRRPDGDFGAPGAAQADPAIEDLPKIMPALPPERPSG